MCIRDRGNHGDHLTAVQTEAVKGSRVNQGLKGLLIDRFGCVHPVIEVLETGEVALFTDPDNSPAHLIQVGEGMESKTDAVALDGAFIHGLVDVRRQDFDAPPDGQGQVTLNLVADILKGIEHGAEELSGPVAGHVGGNGCNPGIAGSMGTVDFSTPAFAVL